MKNVLIILLGAIGDVARGFSLLSPLKEAFPEIRLTWLVEPKSEGLVKCHPLIDEIIVFERQRGIRGVLDVARLLRTRSFDLTLDLQRHAKSGLFSFLSRASRRIGFHPKDCKEGNWLWNTEYIEQFGNERSKVDHYLLFLKKLGISPPKKAVFGLRKQIASFPLPENITAFDKPLLGLVMGSSWGSKNWVKEGYVQVAEKLLEVLPHTILLLGDKSQKKFSEEVQQSISSQFADRVSVLAGKTTLQELLAVLARCDAVAGPDSGPGHLAALAETPYIGLFGPTDAARVAPYHSSHLIVKSDIACSPCWRRTCPGLTTLCMRTLPVPEVCRLVLQGVGEKQA